MAYSFKILVGTNRKTENHEEHHKNIYSNLSGNVGAAVLFARRA
jgi:hypothetical protein